MASKRVILPRPHSTITYREVPEDNARIYSHPGCTEPEGRRWVVPMDDSQAGPDEECPGCIKVLPVRHADFVEERERFLGGEQVYYRRSPRAVAYVDLQGFPLDNLHRDGCKHDVYGGDEDLLRGGAAMPCAKCGALLIPAAVIRRLYAEMIHLFPELALDADDLVIARNVGGDALWEADRTRYPDQETPTDGEDDHPR